ncbi:hypothetical protein K4P40_11210 [Staphylococcus epidermidis]|nr:hypothetical protein [Staphylococcus epidermidis]
MVENERGVIKLSDNRNKKRKYQIISRNEEKQLIDNEISKERFYERLARGWSRNKALSKPVNHYIKITDEEKKLMQENGIDNRTFRARVSRNMDRKKAATQPKRKYDYKKK